MYMKLYMKLKLNMIVKSYETLDSSQLLQWQYMQYIAIHFRSSVDIVFLVD